MILFWSVDVSGYVYVQPPQRGLKWRSRWLSSPFFPSHWLEDRCSDWDTSNHFDSDVTLVMEITRGRVTQRRSLLLYTCELLTSLALATSSLLNNDTRRENLFLLHVIPVFFFFFFFFCQGTWDVGFLLPDQGLNPHPLHWKHRVLTTGHPGKSQVIIFCFIQLKLILIDFHIPAYIPFA